MDQGQRAAREIAGPAGFFEIRGQSKAIGPTGPTGPAGPAGLTGSVLQPTFITDVFFVIGCITFFHFLFGSVKR